MKRTLLLLLVLQLFVKAQSQDTIKNKFLEIHLNPVSILDAKSRYTLGFEYSATQHLSFVLDAGFGNSSINKPLIQYYGDYDFYEFRTECKWYWLKINYQSSLYSSLEMFYMNLTTLFTDSYYFPENHNYNIDYSSAVLNQSMVGGHLKTGIFVQGPGKFTWDIFGGIGYIYKNQTYSKVENPTINYDEHFIEWFPQDYRSEGMIDKFRVVFGIKLGYKLWTEK